MSISNEITRISDQVTTQASIIDEIENILKDKATPRPNLQEKTVMPANVPQDVTADSGYDGLRKVTVEAAGGTNFKIEYIRCLPLPSDNPAGPSTEYIFNVLKNGTFVKEVIAFSDVGEMAFDLEFDICSDVIALEPVSDITAAGYYISGPVLIVQGYAN